MTDNEKSRAEWTVMVYFAADNNLEAEAVKDIVDIKTIGSNKSVNIVAQFESRFNRGASRYFFRKGTMIHEDIVQTFREVDTGDPKVLSDFIKWATTTYPSKKTLLVLWGHGFGWESSKKPVIGSPMLGFLYDEHPGDGKTESVLRMDDFRKAMKDAYNGNNKKIDILGMDACLMGMIEVGYEIKEYVDFMVASQDPMPNDGWPYALFLERLIDRPDMTAEQLARIISREFIRKYLDREKDSVLSAVNLDKLELLAKSLSQLSKELIEKIEHNEPHIRAAIFAARAKTQRFFVDDYVDLYHFCWNLKRFSNDEKIKRLSKEVMNKIRYTIDDQSSPNLSKHFDTNNNATTEFGYIGHRLKGAKGISIYFPCIAPLASYDNTLQFVKNSKWKDFLSKLTEIFPSFESAAQNTDINNGGYKTYLGASAVSQYKVCEGSDEKDCLGSSVRIPADPFI